MLTGRLYHPKRPCSSVGTYILLCLYLLFVTPIKAEESIHVSSNLTKVVLQLKWVHQFQFAGYYAAKEKGFYEEEGIDVEIRPRTKDINHIDEVLEKRADFGVSDSSLILYRLKGKPVVVLAAIYQHSPLVLITRAEDHILGPLELKGKRVMMQSGIDAAALTAMFSIMQMNKDDIVFVPHSLDDNSLIRKETDAISAYISNQPFFYKEKGQRINIINPANYGIDFYGDMLFTREDFIKQNPELVMRFRRASIKGWDYALKHKYEIAKLIHEKYKSDKSLVNLENEADATQLMVMPNLIEIGHLNTQRFNRIADIYKNEKLTAPDASIKGIDYKDYLPENRKRPGWVLWIIITAVVLALSILLLLAISWRLRCLVKIRTSDLANLAKKLQRYIDIVDRYVITSQTTPDGVITAVSDAFCRISGYSREELVGRQHNIIRNPKMPKIFFAEMWDTIKSGKIWKGEILNRSKSGNDYWVEGNIEPVYNKDGVLSGYSSLRIDITDKKRIEHISEHDRLTELYNRTKLDKILASEAALNKRYKKIFSIIIIDIDHFKQVNDKFGHQTGDKVLKEFSEIIRKNCRETDSAGRWGGEEFIIVCPETNAEGTANLAEHLRSLIELFEFTTVGKKTASFGVSEYTNCNSVEDLIKKADQALYEAKENGRNRVVIKT